MCDLKLRISLEFYLFAKLFLMRTHPRMGLCVSYIFFLSSMLQLNASDSSIIYRIIINVFSQRSTVNITLHGRKKKHWNHRRRQDCIFTRPRFGGEGRRISLSFHFQQSPRSLAIQNPNLHIVQQKMIYYEIAKFWWTKKMRACKHCINHAMFTCAFDYATAGVPNVLLLLLFCLFLFAVVMCLWRDLFH